MPLSRRGVAALALLAPVLALGLASCSSRSSAAADRAGAAGSMVVDVVAGENFWGNVIGQVGGVHVKVTSIISDPNADPHEYEADAKDAAAIAGAKFVLENGLGYDDFMGRLLSASPSSSRDVLSVQNILDITGRNPNPHIWYDTARLPQVVAAIVTELGKRDPADAAQFQANGLAFDDSLKPITNVITEIKSKYAGTPIAYTERVPGYLVDAAGLVLGVPSTFTQAIEDGNDPAPADTAKFDAAITGKKVKVLLYNAQVTDPETDKIKQLAQQSGVPVVGVTETLPPSDQDFQAWQLRQATQILQALGG